jgi:predicted ribosomally synthesized peptide with SipW-like signal peptide
MLRQFAIAEKGTASAGFLPQVVIPGVWDQRVRNADAGSKLQQCSPGIYSQRSKVPTKQHAGLEFEAHRSRRNPMFRKMRAFLALGVFAGAAWTGTYASFTDSATATSTFTAGTIDLLLSGEADDAYSFTSINLGNMKPGDLVYAPLTIANNGTLPFNYTMATAASNGDGLGLGAQLTLGVKKVANTGACDAGGVGYAASSDVLLAEGALNGGAIASRALASGSSEVACFKVLLPLASGDVFQGSTTTATFTFSATQQ